MGQKGPAYERKFCKELSLWWTQADEDPCDAIFWRTANSGGRATVRSRKNLKTKHQQGDITATDPRGIPLMHLLTVELKKGYSRFSLYDLLDKPEKGAVQEYEGWVSKNQETSQRNGTFSWILVTMRDRREAILTCPFALYQALKSHGSRLEDARPFQSLLLPSGLHLASMRLRDFLEGVSPVHVRSLVQSLERREVS